ncbi:cystatin-like fold lipoprotein, partial [Staphylococcus capitis]|uniref:cystatin-like fold lipoprotein n=1 Tax=Staphylococcus capitis TaxID=29388 RepID=UPI003709B47E
MHKALKIQHKKQQKIPNHHTEHQLKHFHNKHPNIYLFKKPKYLILPYKPFTHHPELHYYTYDFKAKKPHYKQNFNSKAYYEEHEPHY